MQWLKSMQSRRYWTALAIELAFFALGMAVVPRLWCGWPAGGWYDGDARLQAGLGARMERALDESLSTSDFHTGSPLFSGEWLFGTYMMAGLGLGQSAREHPDLHDRHVKLMETCIDRMVSQDVAAFDTDMWRNSALATLADGTGHVAYLGYLNLVLSMHRYLVPESRYGDLLDRITAALAQRLDRSPLLLDETYPGHVFPIDNSSAVGSIKLYDAATGQEHSALLSRWSDACRRRYRDAQTGLLYQAVDPDSGAPTDFARGSGTALAAYFLSFADPQLSRELFESARTQLADSVLGFGLVREYARDHEGGRGDVDSGPVVFGYGVSPTGFLISTARVYGDRGLYTRLYRTTYLFGAPLKTARGMNFTTGGPLGNAILFAMLTAQPAGSWARPRP